MTTRKAIAAALLAQLTNGQSYANTGRRDRAPEQAASPGAPGLILVKPDENYKYDSGYGVPPVRDLHFFAVIYTDVGNVQNAVPADVIDDLMDAVDAALAPTILDQMNNNGRQSLGGLVDDCRVDGKVEFAPGDVQGKGTTIVPITVVLKSYP